jgi:hypothetical protein
MKRDNHSLDDGEVETSDEVGRRFAYDIVDELLVLICVLYSKGTV